MTEASVWQTAPLNATVDHVLSRYHDTHRRQLEGILPLLDKVRQVHQDKFPADLYAVVMHLAQELDSHMQKEERMLFPMIKQGMEHDDHSSLTEQILQLTDQLTPPADACGSWQNLYAQLRELLTDLHDHIELENTILFPRALNE